MLQFLPDKLNMKKRCETAEALERPEFVSREGVLTKKQGTMTRPYDTRHSTAVYGVSQREVGWWSRRAAWFDCVL